jgi:hypothetical protein
MQPEEKQVWPSILLSLTSSDSQIQSTLTSCYRHYLQNPVASTDIIYEHINSLWPVGNLGIPQRCSQHNLRIPLDSFFSGAIPTCVSVSIIWQEGDEGFILDN